MAKLKQQPMAGPDSGESSNVTRQIKPAMVFLLMTGTQSTRRLPGWVWLAQHEDIGGAVRSAWARHGATLSKIATAAGFTPWATEGQTPTGPHVKAWAEAFLSAHVY
jgi:hypothetical protein